MVADFMKIRKQNTTMPGHCCPSVLLKTSFSETVYNRQKTKTVSNHFKFANINNHQRRQSHHQLLRDIDEQHDSPETMSSSTSTTSSTTAGTTPLSNSSIYLNDKILYHEHTRLLPQQQQQHQAILTTYDDWRIILTNDIAQEVLMGYHDHFLQSDNNELVGKSVINDLIDPTYQTRLKEIVHERRLELMNRQDEYDHVGGMVLVCGNVVMYYILFFLFPFFVL
jgi:hypothetical protein